MDFTPSQWRIFWAVALTLAYGVLCVGIFWRHRKKIAHDATLAQTLQRAHAQNDAHTAPPVLVAWASQTGQAQLLAEQTADWLRQNGCTARLCALNAVDAATLAQSRMALFVASTYGEGDAPDSAAVFFNKIMGLQDDLGHLQFATLALGDAQYAQFCGFARTLDGWLVAQGAHALFERIEVNTAQPTALDQALAQWQQRLVAVFAAQATSAKKGDFCTRALEAKSSDLALNMSFSVAKKAEFAPWHIVRRERLNAGSQGAGVWLLDLLPAHAALPEWASGDLIDIHTEGDGGYERSYSIASIAADGRVQLLVRQSQRTDGSWGHTSTQLCVHLPVVEENSQIHQSDTFILSARIKPHTAFRLGDNAARPLILIGNGTGLAGLRSHLHTRAAEWAHQTAPAPCWLLFGERQRHCDSLLHAELVALKERGVIARLDWAFSRDVDEHGQTLRVYVQDRVREAADELREWTQQRDAAIYVCGSLKGMASGVDEALREVLGSDAVDELLKQGRYRRDVY